MIRFAGQDQFGAFVEWLNKRYPASQPVTLAVLPGYDCVADDDGTPGGWAAYTPGDRVIWCPGEPPQVDGLSDAEIKEIMLQHLAHEYVHHLQACQGRAFDEDEAETLAHEMVAEFKRVWGGNTVQDRIPPGTIVEWNSQSQGSWKRKCGRVVAYLPPNADAYQALVDSGEIEDVAEKYRHIRCGDVSFVEQNYWWSHNARGERFSKISRYLVAVEIGTRRKRVVYYTPRAERVRPATQEDDV